MEYEWGCYLLGHLLVLQFTGRKGLSAKMYQGFQAMSFFCNLYLILFSNGKFCSERYSEISNHLHDKNTKHDHKCHVFNFNTTSKFSTERQQLEVFQELEAEHSMESVCEISISITTGWSDTIVVYTYSIHSAVQWLFSFQKWSQRHIFQPTPFSIPYNLPSGTASKTQIYKIQQITT